MRIERWKKWEGEGTPEGEWKVIDGVVAIKVEDITYHDNSPEAIALVGKLNGLVFSTVRCKECGTLMEKYLLHPHPKANRLGWKFRYICSNNDCLYEYYTKEDV